MRIGIFGGSFDPPHSEHQNLVEAAKKSLSLDKIFIVPAAVPPHKRGKTLSANEHRLQMCRLAFSGIEKTEVSDFEMRVGGVSYTYLTCQYFKEKFPDSQLFWFVGTDMLRDFPSWKNPETILSLATLAVCARSEEEDWIEKESRAFETRFEKKFAVIDYHGKDISSTKIRVLAGAGADISPFTGKAVAEYIERNELYKIPFAETSLMMQTDKRKAHSLRVAFLAAARAPSLKISERKAVTAALFHDCAKNLPLDSPCLSGFSAQGVPKAVVHQYAGAYLTEYLFGVEDEEILNAVRFHTSGRAEMTPLEQLIFLSDMLEEERVFSGVEKLRELFWRNQTLDECMFFALKDTLSHLKEKGGEIYPLTQEAYEYYGRLTENL
ncbi:MAG: nicotinate (nicotinamide) nucleotide adenylyltransferase [Clostridia bacterium]|nr:nicotinate (nicotinamide) nucleotide adenylyltransferase [Clostridia bacterium]